MCGWLHCLLLPYVTALVTKWGKTMDAHSLFIQSQLDATEWSPISLWFSLMQNNAIFV